MAKLRQQVQEVVAQAEKDEYKDAIKRLQHGLPILDSLSSEYEYYDLDIPEQIEAAHAYYRENLGHAALQVIRYQKKYSTGAFSKRKALGPTRESTVLALQAEKKKHLDDIVRRNKQENLRNECNTLKEGMQHVLDEDKHLAESIDDINLNPFTADAKKDA